MSKDILMKIFAIAVVGILMSALGWLWLANYPTDGSDGPGGDGLYEAPPVGSGLTTPFQEDFQDPSYEVDPLDYTLPLTEDQVLNLQSVAKAIDLTAAQVQFLMENGMVGVAKNGIGFVSFSTAYEYIQKNSNKPTFITSDSVLDAYHHIFEGVLIELETDDMSEKAKVLARRLMWASDAQVRDLLPEDKDLARMNVVYFGVALRIFDKTADVPKYAEEDIGNIIGMIEAADGILPIPGFDQKEDFTQYKPRGHYTRSPELSRYFKGMMWFGRITFQGKFDDEARKAVLVAIALKEDKPAWNAYVSMSNVIDFMVGHPDDLTVHEVLEVVEDVMGSMDGSYAALFDDEKLAELKETLADLRPPKINSDVIFPNETVWGMRVFGQRYVPDSYIFQELVYSKVPDRFMPSCLDVFAVMGSEEAWDREAFDKFGTEFDSQLISLKGEFTAYSDEYWTSTLYTSWLQSLRSIHQSTPGREGPGFMETRAWSAKELNAQAASWTQLTHDTLLYRKQSYTERSGFSPRSDIIYVEPVPLLYSRLGDMVEATKEGLQNLWMGNQLVFDKLETYGKTLDTLERVAVAELEGRSPDPDDVSSLLRYYNTIAGLNEMAEGEDTKTILISDVHTDPNSGQCLQEAVGPVRLMVVVIPTDQGNIAAIGAVFEHYEFTQPMSNRLTDEEWKAMLDKGTAPDPSPWAKDFNP
jgi:hypothetical protein